LKASAESLSKQHQAMKQQNFEATFFQLLRLHSDQVRELHMDLFGHPRNGRSVLKQILYEIEGNNRSELSFETLERSFSENYFFYEDSLAQYFGSLFSIIQFIDDTPDIDQHIYAHFVSAQLTSIELILILYFCVMPIGGRARPLTEKYALLKNMLSASAPPEGICWRLERSAFGGRYPVPRH
jgi:hypothetical protein